MNLMTAGTVLLRAVPGQPPPDKETVYRTIATKLNVLLTGLRPNKTGFTAYTARQNDSDKFFTKTADKTLKDIGLTPTLTAKKRAERSLICRQVVDFAGQHSEEDIRRELCDKNNMDIIKVTKFPTNNRTTYKTHVFKAEFKLTEETDKAKRDGLRLFNTFIAPRQIQQDEFFDLTMCFRCYALEAHTTNNCPRPATYTVCSHCGTEGHTHQNCPNPTTFRCLICKGADHRTMQMRCPTKKDLQKQKLQASKSASSIQPSAQSYASITARPSASTLPPPPVHSSAPASNSQSLMTLYLLHAHMNNVIKPGSFQQTFNSIQKHLGATVCLPVDPNPDSTKLLKTLTADIPTMTMTNLTAPLTKTTMPPPGPSTSARTHPVQQTTVTELERPKTKTQKTAQDPAESTSSDGDSTTTQTGFKQVRVTRKKKKTQGQQQDQQQQDQQQQRQQQQPQTTQTMTKPMTTTTTLTPRTTETLLERLQADIQTTTHSTRTTQSTAYIRLDAPIDTRRDIDVIQATHLYQQGLIKIQPQHTSIYSYDQLTDLLDNNNLIIKRSDIEIVDETTFAKLRPDRQRTPPQGQTKARNRTDST